MPEHNNVSGLDRVEPWIITPSGRELHPFDPAPEEIDIGDIARSLSRNCRFSGNLSDQWGNDIYTVAQHCVYVVGELQLNEARLWGLLHDASEFPFGDIVSPVKSRFPEYKKAENEFGAHVRGRFSVPFSPEIDDAVKKADLDMFFAEAYTMTVINGTHWGGTGGASPRTMYDVDPNFRPWFPLEARTRFLEMYEELTGE